jgi:hypothetical protein
VFGAGKRAVVGVIAVAGALAVAPGAQAEICNPIDSCEQVVYPDPTNPWDHIDPVNDPAGAAAIAEREATGAVTNHTDTPPSAEDGGYFADGDSGYLTAADGLPADCVGRAVEAVYDQASKQITFDVGLSCNQQSTMRVQVCEAIKTGGVGATSTWQDVACNPETTYSTYAHQWFDRMKAACTAGDHEYRTHAYLTVERGAQVWKASGYQGGRLHVPDC